MAEDRPQPRRRSRARWLIPLAVLFVFFAFCGGLALLFVGTFATAEKTATGTILELRLDGEVSESPEAIAAIFPAFAGPPSLYEIRKALQHAAHDDKIAGLRIDVEHPAIGWATADELGQMLRQFRAAKKPVHAYLRSDLINDLEYATTLGADKVWITPNAAVAINGLRAEVTFWRGTLDKLHIEPQYYGLREYKGASEPFVRQHMSEPFRESLNDVLGDIWEGFLAEVAARRDIPLAAARDLADKGLVTSEEMADAKWVDAIGYEDQIEDELRQAAHTDSYHGLELRKYLRHMGQNPLARSNPKVAVVIGSGVIVSASERGAFDSTFAGPVIGDAIRQAADDDDVKAILLRVNSPGGSPVGSDFVWRAVDYARSQRKKPVVVSMSDYAASGGYWVSMNSDAIVAYPSTLTGSIGVVFGKVNVRGLYEMAGANVDVVATARNAGMISLVESFDAEQQATVLNLMESLYDDFKEKVGEGRGLKDEQVEALAKGRVWSGTDAKGHGLVDRLGGYDEALAVVRSKAGLGADTELDLVLYPRPKTLFEILLSDELAVDARALAGRVDPRAALERTLRELTRPGALLLAPAVIVD